MLPPHLAAKLSGRWGFIEKRANKNRFTDDKEPEGPGPAAFNTRDCLPKGTGAVLTGRHKPISTGGAAPGPGAYSPAAVAGPVAPAYSMGARGELQTGEAAEAAGPGPGAYNTAAAAEALKTAAPRFGFGVKTGHELEKHESPGPAAYTPRPPKAGKGAGIGSAPRRLGPVEKDDEAGVDEIKPDITWTTPRAPAFSLGGRVKATQPSNALLGPGPGAYSTVGKLGRKDGEGGGGVPFSTQKRMKEQRAMSNTQFMAATSTLSKVGGARSSALQRPAKGGAAPTDHPGPAAYAPRAKLGATNAPSWGKATAPKEQAKKASTLAEAAGPGPAMYDTATSWARQEGLGTGPVAPMSGRHAFGSFLPPELAAEKPTEEMVAEQPVGDGKRLRLKAMMEAELAKLGV